MKRSTAASPPDPAGPAPPFTSLVPAAAHDLATLRSTIELDLQSLRQTGLQGLSPAVTKRVQRVLAAARAMGDVAHGFLHAARAGEGSGDAEPASVDDLLSELRSLVEARMQAKRAQLRVQAPPGLRLTRNAQLARRTLLILTDNAVKHVGHGRVTIVLTRERDTLRIRVSDPGGAKAPAGFGIGLRLLRNQLERCGGALQLAVKRTRFVAEACLPIGQ